MSKAMDVFKALSELTVYDITPPFESNMPVCLGNPSLWIVPDARTYERNGYFLQTLVMGEHVGSHIDAACHTQPGKPSIDTYAPNYFIAPYKKYNLEQFGPQAGEAVGLDRIRECEEKDGFVPEEGDIVLIHYGFDKYFFLEREGKLPVNWYGSNAPGLTDEVEEYFLSKRIRAIGADTSNCEIPQKDGVSLKLSGHAKYFLPNNIPIMESFVHMGRAPATGIFLALPLPIRNGSGSPVRALLLA